MKKKNPKQIAALVCVVILVALYLLTLIFAIADFPGWQRMFGGCLVGTIALPILLWIYIWLYGKIRDRHTIASFDIGGSADGKPCGEQNAGAAEAEREK